MTRFTRGMTPRAAVTAVAVAGAALAGSTVLPASAAWTETGPSTTIPSYVIPATGGVSIRSLLTVGNKAASNGYRMVGVPDGLAAYSSGSNTVVLMNQELNASAGIVRAHGQEGAFVSKYVINASGRVVKGEDFITSISYFDYPTASDVAVPTGGFDARLGRLCSSSMSTLGQFFNATTSRGTPQRIYFANEETGDNGRVFGIDRNGVARQLPRLGLASWENSVPAPTTSDTTVVIGNEDGSAGQVWVYKGTKTRGAGLDVFDKAGLTNGAPYVLAISDGAGGHYATDSAFRAAKDAGDVVPFSIARIGWNQTGAAQNAEAATKGTSLNRIEDGAFDPNDKNVYYFVTTDGGEGTGEGGGGGLWRMTFTDIENPTLGGTIELVLDGSEAITMNKPDNLTLDTHGNLLIQEDPGNVDAIARIVAYRTSDGALGEVATFDPNLFQPGRPNFLTKDEESSGIIDLEVLGHPAGTFLFDAQVHTSSGLAADPNPAADNPGTVDEFVERGQLSTLTVEDWNLVYDIFPI